MDFLDICVALHRECGGSGNPPSATTNQTGELLRFVNWGRQAYTEIQNLQPNWRWLTSEFSLQTVANTDEYAYDHAGMTDAISGTAITRFSRWWVEEFQIYLTSAGIATRHSLPHVRWEDHRRAWHTGSQNAGYPSEVSIDPRNKLRLGAKPNGIYTLTGDYQKGPQTLTDGEDEPEMPERFHQLIVFRGMKKYAAFAGAPEVWASARDEHDQMMLDLEIDQLPEPRFGNALC